MNLSSKLTIFCDTSFGEDAERELCDGTARHELVFARTRTQSNLASTAVDPALSDADVILGQPPVDGLLSAPLLHWVHLTSAGYTRYDTHEVRAALENRRIALTTSSTVYADPCAEHVLAMMLAMARRLPDSLDAQRTSRAWDSVTRRSQSVLLRGQTVLLLGYGAIGRRLAELLQPFGLKILIYRRRRDETCRGMTMVHDDQMNESISQADHVVNLLPENDTTRGFFDQNKIAQMHSTAILYNVGRGTTIDQNALLDALQGHRIAGAYLDVTEVEPLPQDHPLWSAPNCFVTPHSAGGQRGEQLALVRHFLECLRRFEQGEPLLDRVV